jgi:formylglycine-generating enzyme required for sulfatase activity
MAPRARLGQLVCLAAAVASGTAHSAPARPIVAVFNIEAKSLRLDRSRLSELSDYFADSLAATGAFQVVPRDRLKKRLVELKKKSYQACYDQSCQVEIGRELAANKSLATRVMRIGKKCVVTSTLYDLRKAATEAGATAEGGCGVDALRELVKRVVRALAGERADAVSSSQPAPRVARGKDGCPMVRVPAGAFLRGSPAGKGGEDESPQQRIVLAAFAVDQHEVTVGQYRQCLRAGACSEPGAEPECNWLHADRARHPVTCVDWQQARSYCAWVGKRLPTEAEWEKAARGANGASYPWGEERPSCRRAVMADGGGRGCGAKRSWPVGSRPGKGNAYGLLDMAGNVAEWVADGYAPRYYLSSPTSNPPGPAASKTRVHRGGSWQDDAPALRSAARENALPGYRHFDLGFRCAK